LMESFDAKSLRPTLGDEQNAVHPSSLDVSRTGQHMPSTGPRYNPSFH
jgi:hypothetical protein